MKWVLRLPSWFASKPAEPKQRSSIRERSQPIRHKRERVDITVGIDFGTSNTKIVYSRTEHFSRPVILDHGLSDYETFCIPSLASISRSGKLDLGVAAAETLAARPFRSGIRNMKMLVAGRYDEHFRNPLSERDFERHMEQAGADPDVFTPERLATAFIAHCIRTGRQAVEHDTDLANADLNLLFQVCVPIAHMEQPRVRRAFEDIALNAELVERYWPKASRDYNLLNATAEAEDWPDRIDASDRRVAIIPEAVAEAASYLKSPAKQLGLHCLIDFGSGTTDVSVFNVAGSATPKSFFYSSDSIPWGCGHIDAKLVELLATEADAGVSVTHLELAALLDELTRGRHAHDGPFNEELLGSAHGIVRSQFRDFHNGTPYRQVWRAAYCHRKKTGLWKNVRVFLCGGGARFDGCTSLFSTPPDRQFSYRYRVEPLPVPADYDTRGGDAPFSRMEVAYGLAIPRPLYEDYSLPSRSPDHTPELDYNPNRPDRDDLYAK